MSDAFTLSFLVPPGEIERLKRSPTLRAGIVRRPVTRSYRLAVFDDGAYSHRAKPLVEESVGSAAKPANGVALADHPPNGANALLEGALTRSLHVLSGDQGQTISAQLESGMLSGPLGSLPIARLTLAQERGETGPLLNLADALRAEFLLRLVIESDVERGYSMLTQAGPAIVRAREAEITADMPAGQAAALVLRNCLGQWLANDLAVRARQIEGVHQMRVALRRLRAALALFGDLLEATQLNHLDREAKWLARLLGTARDWDVFLDTTLRPLMAQRPDEPCLAATCEAIERRRSIAYDEVLHGLDAPRTAALAFDLAAAAVELEAASDAERPIGDLAQRALERRYAKVLRRGRHLERLDAEQRHELRIQLKKLRYGTDFFRFIYPGNRRKKFATELGDLQDLFGILNDAATAENLILQLYGAPSCNAADTPSSDAALASGLVIGWHLGASRHQHERLTEQWQRLAEAKPFWR